MANYRLIYFDKIPSTQTCALDMVADGQATDRTVILAQAQSSGRGRYRRGWVSHRGNLYASFIFRSDERDPRLSYIIAVAIVETLVSLGVTPAIKWPNDILIKGEKVCGVLIEYASNFVIVGIGINVKTNPTVADYQTTKLGNYCDVSVQLLLNRLLKNLDKWIKTDFLVARSRWMDFATALNKTVRYRGEKVELIGINLQGALVLRHNKDYFLAYGDEITM